MDVVAVTPEAAALDARQAGQRTCSGISLTVDKQFHRRGFRRLLRTVPGELGFDWSFGMQFKSLGNPADWQKVRNEVVDLGHCWLTAGRVAPLPSLATARTPELIQAHPPTI